MKRYCLSIDFLLDVEHLGNNSVTFTRANFPANKLIHSRDAKKHTDKGNRYLFEKKEKKNPLADTVTFEHSIVRDIEWPPLDSKIHPVQATKAGHLLDGGWPAQLPGGITPDINAVSLEISSRINLCPVNEAVTRDSGDRAMP